MIQILTATGARPEAWGLCMRWMARQTYTGLVHWVIVDDGPEPQEVPPWRKGWTISVQRPQPFWERGQNTQLRNIRLGMDLIEDREPLVLVEDDDHVAPGWLDRIYRELNHSDIVGQQLCRKYNLGTQRARELTHPYRASLCATGLRGPGITRLRRIVGAGPKLIDTMLWKPGLGRLFDGCYVTGMKSLPGRPGIDSGHRLGFGEISDADGSLLRQWVGPEDAKVYETMTTRPTRKGEIAVYATCYESSSYAMGARRRADVQRFLTSLRPGSLLDVGCGRGEALTFAEAAGHRPLMGTEVVPTLLGERAVYAEAHDLPFADGEFDHVTCWDVLEHLTEPDIRPALREMWRVAGRTVTASASERKDVRNGRDLHISRRPAAEWLQLVQECWGPNAKQVGTAGASPMFHAVKL